MCGPQMLMPPASPFSALTSSEPDICVLAPEPAAQSRMMPPRLSKLRALMWPVLLITVCSSPSVALAIIHTSPPSAISWPWLLTWALSTDSSTATSSRLS